MTQGIEKAVILQPESVGSIWREIGKIDNGIVVVTTHLYDGTKSLPLDLELYRNAKVFTLRKTRQRISEKTPVSFTPLLSLSENKSESQIFNCR
jgi:hypothetical protein